MMLSLPQVIDCVLLPIKGQSTMAYTMITLLSELHAWLNNTIWCTLYCHLFYLTYLESFPVYIYTLQCTGILKAHYFRANLVKVKLCVWLVRQGGGAGGILKKKIHFLSHTDLKKKTSIHLRKYTLYDPFYIYFSLTSRPITIIN